jgi:hypothetical protein
MARVRKRFKKHYNDFRQLITSLVARSARLSQYVSDEDSDGA